MNANLRLFLSLISVMTLTVACILLLHEGAFLPAIAILVLLCAAMGIGL